MDSAPQRHDPTFNEAMTDLLRRSGVNRSSVIRVMGPGGLAPLLWFCRHGYEQVGYVRQGPCPADSCDLLIVMQGAETASLRQQLEQGPHLREGGVLVVQTSQPGPVARTDPVDQLARPLRLPA